MGERNNRIIKQAYQAGAFWLMLLSLLFVSPVSAKLQLYNPELTQRINGSTLTLWESTATPLTIDEVLEKRNDFQWPTNANPNYGFSDQGIWFYNKFSNVSDNGKWVADIGFAQNDLVEFYLVINDEVVAQSKQGKQIYDRAYRFPTFMMELPFATEAELFIRVQSAEQALVVPIDLQSAHSHSLAIATDNIWWGVFYGGLIILLFYNLVLYADTREFSLVAYLCYIFAAILWQFVWGGHSQLTLDRELSDWLNQHTDFIFTLLGLAAGFFTLAFLNAKNTAPKTWRFIIVMMFIQGILLVTTLVGIVAQSIQNALVYIISMIAICCYLFAGLESYLNNFKPARYFVFAWSILLISALTGMLGLVGIFPSNFVTTYCFQIGVFFEAALFSIALIEKTRHKLELEVEEATDDLRNNMEIFEEQNVRLDMARKEAVKASKIKSQFLANMSHEIRTPLNAILGFSQELSKTNMPLEQQEHVQIINQSASNLLAIVNDVLDFSKIEAGKLQINQEAFSPGEILEELVFIFAKAAQKKHLIFSYDAQPLPEKLLGDGVRIKQILTNLLSNALKFTNEGEIGLRVNVKEMGDDIIQWRLAVEDTGIGIAEINRSRLFKSFSQLDDALNRSYQGTGLGLVISQQLVQLMRGKIRFDSEYGRGSCFEVTLNCHKISHSLDIAPHPYWRNKRVLLLDCSPASRLSSVRLLTGLGADVYSGNSLMWLQEQYEQFDFFFTDVISMHKMDPALFERVVRTLDVETRVLLTVQNEMSENPLAAYFQKFVDAPLLLTRLVSFENTSEPASNDIWNERLAELPPVSILAVDDMPINLRLLDTWLQDTPISLTLSYSGPDAVEQCQQNEFDLILMDVQMPDMDGLETTRAIRKTPLNQGTPVIAVTAHAFKEEQERLMSSGMDDYLPKPVEFGALINQIKRWCSVPDTEIDHLNDLDWDLAINRANSNQDAAREMMHEFIKQLPGAMAEIQAAAQGENWEEMQKSVHKLHGASCYTGVPRLQKLCAQLEAELKEQNISEVQRLLPQFLQASRSLLQEASVAGA